MLGAVDEDNEGWKGSVGRRVILYFTAEWCGPCKKLGPLILKTAQKYSEDIDFYKLDADVEKGLVEFYEIKSVPTLVLLKSNTIWEKITPQPSETWLEDYFYKALIKK